GAQGRRLTPVRGVHDVRDRVSGALYLHRRHGAPQPGDRKGPRAIRHRSRQVRVLWLLRRSLPGGRDPDGYRDPGVRLVQSVGDDLLERGASGPGAGTAEWHTHHPGSPSAGPETALRRPGTKDPPGRLASRAIDV